MSDQDRITKGAAYEAVNALVMAFVRESEPLSPKDLKEAIDALDPVDPRPVAEGDLVSGTQVLNSFRVLRDKIKLSISTDIHEQLVLFEQYLAKLPAACSERSESVQPAADRERSGRSEDEIRRAIKILSTKYSSKRSIGETIAMAEYCLGKENYLAKLFHPPASEGKARHIHTPAGCVEKAPGPEPEKERGNED